MSTCRERQFCRLCAGRMQLKLSLTPTPVANNYSEKPDAGAKRYPLELSECSRCGHVQQRYVLSGLFHDYRYSTPATVATYLDPVAKLLRERYPKARTVLEIGSNNGTYLKVLRAHGLEATGIDPAASGDGNIKAYFNARWASTHDKRYDLIVGNNVFAHIDDLRDVFNGIEFLLADGGAVVFEVQYFLALVKAGTFDAIYAEHVSHHTLAPLAKFATSLGMIMTSWDFIPTHGGSIRVTFERPSKTTKQADFAEEVVDWEAFAQRVASVKERVRSMLRGRKVVLLGAAAKATTLIHHCEIADSILYACDETPEKNGRYIPGTDIKILPINELGDHPAMVCAWNYMKFWKERFPNNELLNPHPDVEGICATLNGV